MDKIFEANSSFRVKQRTTGKVRFLFARSFLLVLTKFSFWEDWSRGYKSMKFWDFSDLSWFLKILSLKPFGNSWRNYSTARRCCPLHLIKWNCVLKTFLPVFPSWTNLKLHNISVTPKLVKKVITNLNSSKASGPDCILFVVVKNCEPENSYTLAELSIMCLKQSRFPDCWKISSVVPVFKNVGEGSTTKNYRPVSLLLVFKNL